MAKRKPASYWVQMFATNVAEQSDVLWRDGKSGNQYARRYIDAWERLRAMGDVGRDALSVLFDHPRPDVRISAAACLLRHRTEEALAVLWKEAAGEGLVSFEAQQCIKRWEEGTWQLDPE